MKSPNDPCERAATKDEVAARYQVTVRTIENWMKAGLLPYMKLGGKLVRFNLAEVEEAIKRKCGRNQSSQ